MFAFIAREPILDKSKSVFAYELIFRDGKGGAYPEHSPEKAQYIEAQFHPLGLDDISGEKSSFINFSSETLISRFPTTLDPASVVVELADNPPRNGATWSLSTYQAIRLSAGNWWSYDVER